METVIFYTIQLLGIIATAFYLYSDNESLPPKDGSFPFFYGES